MLLQVGSLVTLGVHFAIFFDEFYLYAEPSFTMNLAHCISTVFIIPILYSYSARSIDALHLNDLSMLLILCLLGFVVHGSMNFGLEPKVVELNKHFMVSVYHNETLLLSIRSQHVALLAQAFFCLYKIGILTTKMYQHKYHYTDDYKRFLVVASIGLLMSIISIFPPNSLWYSSGYTIVFTVVMMGTIGVGFLFLAFGYDKKPLVNKFNQPVSFSKHNRFVELASHFEKLVNSEQLYLREGIKMDEVARMLGTNRTYLSQMMRDYYNTTFSTYMNRLRIEEAKSLLHSSTHDKQLKLQDIAYKSGFTSISSFNKVFKEQTGMTPSEWLSQSAVSSSRINS